MRPLSVLLESALIHNAQLVNFLGLCSTIGVSTKREGAYGMGVATTLVITLATTLGWALDNWLLLPLHAEFMRILSFIVVIASVVQLLELVLRKFLPTLYRDLGVYLPLITVNCAVLGAALLNSTRQYDLVDSAAAGLGTGLGFLGVMVIFAGLRERLSRASVPSAFAGAPIAFLTAGILSLAIMGFEGLGK
jgi:Na+-translocating ferredoxin:NAD+ oxidoreductase subunit A